MELLLAGDIGGTKTALALISADKGVRQPLKESTFPSEEFDSLEAILASFLERTEIDLVTRASFGVAGPVIGHQAEITNLPWLIDAEAIGRTFDISQVYLLNDLVAIANAVLNLEETEVATLNPGSPEPGGAIAVIAPGTGLGESFLTWDGRRYRAHPSEGGHASFAPNTPEQRKLLAYLQTRFGHVSCERVCSGSGIPNIYDYLRDSGQFEEPAWLHQELATLHDRAPTIARLARTEGTEICVATMELFVEILAGEASNLALKVMATGGVYLGGGIPPKILPLLKQRCFMDVFDNKGRFSDLLSELPVRVILTPKAALFGAAHFALENG